MRLRALVLLLLLLACLSLPGRASAHPADMYAQNLFLRLTGDGLQIDWKILPGPFLADAAWAAADADHDGAIRDVEAQAWVAPFVSDLSIQLDGKEQTPQMLRARWPATVDVLRTGEDAVEVTLHLPWPVGMAGNHALEIHNAHLESNSLNWFSVSGEDGFSFSRPDQNNGLLKLTLNVGALEGSNVTSWTSGTPNLPGFADNISRLATNLTAPSSGSAAPNQQSSVTSTLTGLVKNVRASPLFLLTAFLLSLALGSLHALTPGHGKALVGAYLVGSRGRTRDAILLGGVVTLTHTGSVLALGLVTLVASHYILPSLIVPWLEIISGVLVIAFGLNLLIQRRRDLPFLGGAIGSAHEHGEHEHHGHKHSHQPSDIRLQTSDISLAKPGSPLRFSHQRYALRDESSIVNRKSEIVNLRSLLALGVSGGLVPCPDAIAILLVAVALNRVPFGMLLIVSFSLGLAAVLIGIGIAMVNGVRLISRSDWIARFGTYTPILSAVVVTGLGVGLTINAVNSFKFSSALSVSAAPAQPPPNAAAASDFDIHRASILYVTSDASGWDQLFLSRSPAEKPVQLTHASNGISGYSISPDRRTVLYSTFGIDGGSSLWAIDMGNTNAAPQRVLDCPDAECNSPAWYPDGSKIAYERLKNTQDSTTVPRFSIWWLDLAGKKTQPVFQDASFASAAPQFSPDGQWLSYISAASNTLVAFDLKDGRTLSVPLGSQAAIPETWSPTGEALLFGNRAETGEPPPLHVKIYTLATGRITDLGLAGGATDFFAAWSPDGKWIAIDRNVPSSDPSGSSPANAGSPLRSDNQVWLVHPDGSAAHALLSEAGASYSDLSWSPDGSFLLVSRYTRGSSIQSAGHFDVLAVDIQNGASTLLVEAGDLAKFLR